jgi:hypothetical protein
MNNFNERFINVNNDRKVLKTSSNSPVSYVEDLSTLLKTASDNDEDFSSKV